MDQKEIVWLGSRVLTPAETNYSNIERESLGLVEAVKYFHKFIAGRRFTIVTDHRPLKFIFNNDTKISERISSRLQRWAITLKAYDYDIRHINGESMFMADTLSRLPVEGSSLVPTINLCELNSLDDFAMNKSLLARIGGSNSTQLQRLKRFITNGWPVHVTPDMLPYSQTRNEYSIQNGLVYKGLRIVPPREMQSEILSLLHSNHPGINRMIRTARQYFWWPKIDQHINAFVQRCATCQTNANKRTKAHLSAWEDAKNFLERVHVDIGFWKNYKFLLFCDAHSKWVDVQLINDVSTDSAIKALRRTFKYVGLPNAIVTDNGASFSSAKFAEFLKNNFITHIFTPPGHHSSNGLVERMVQTFKNYIKKNHVGPFENVVSSFCLYTNTTFTSEGAVPADFVFIRTPRTRLSAQCTEFKSKESPVPVLVRVENKLPSPATITRPCGTNTYLDQRERLVHRSDITSMAEQDKPDSSASNGNDVPSAFPDCESEKTDVPVLRRSARSRKPPDRLTYP